MMKMKKKISIVVFLLMMCIATISFATSANMTVVNTVDENILNNTVTSETNNVTEGNTLKELENGENIDYVENVVIENNAEDLKIEPRTSITDQVDPISLDEEESIVSNAKTINDNIYKATTDATYTLKDNVYGNVFIAGNEVIVDSDFISGDLFIVANNVTINKDSVIDGNLYIAAQSIKIEGTLYRSVYLAGKTINFSESSFVAYDALIAGELIKINGEMARNVYVYAGTLEVSDTATVGKDLNYEANEKAEVPENVVAGNINFTKIVTDEKSTLEIVLEYVIDLLEALIFTLTIFIIISLISSKFTYKAQEYMGKHVLKSIGIGLFTLIVMPFAAVILILMNSTAAVGVALIPIYILLLFIANAITAIAFSAMLCNRSKGMKLPIVLVLITIALWALELIPYIGTIVAFFSILIGMGVLLQVIFSKNKTISKGEDDIEKINEKIKENIEKSEVKEIERKELKKAKSKVESKAKTKEKKTTKNDNTKKQKDDKEDK